MHKLVFSILMIVIWWMLHALQMDEELAMGTLHEGKRAVDRAAHAAAQQVDRSKLEDGVISVNPALAQAVAASYLQANLRLDTNGYPLSESFLRDHVEVRVFKVINENAAFPFTYRNSAYNYEVTLQRPGVVMIVHIKYPRLYGVIAPVQWDLKGAAELVY